MSDETSGEPNPSTCPGFLTFFGPLFAVCSIVNEMVLLAPSPALEPPFVLSVCRQGTWHNHRADRGAEDSLDVHDVAADTVSAMETCEDCGFAWVQVDRHEIAPRTTAAAQHIASTITANADKSLVRPTVERWSALEYAAHVRDVFLSIRDRLVIGLVEDDPGFKPMYRDERISLGLYATDTATDIAAEVVAAANMLARLFEAIDPQQLDRVVQYGYPDPLPRTLLWMGQQAVHESEHHLADINENLGAD
jgi:DinB superfamily